MDDSLSRKVASLPGEAGVYVFYGTKSEVLYVGKSQNLHKRVSSYFKRVQDSRRIARLVSKIANVEVTLCASAKQALVLESKMIKSLHPYFNVLLRDDKDYPLLLLSDDDFPRLSSFRGRKLAKGNYYGPYVNIGAMTMALDFVQKTFKLRTCRNVEFKNRSRPCLQYQIGRCTAPCVDYVTQTEYAQQAKGACDFLEGRTETLLDNLAAKMRKYSQNKQYEEAGKMRNMIASLREVQGDTVGRKHGDNEFDIITIAHFAGKVGVVHHQVRNGQVVGARQEIMNSDKSLDDSEVIASFVSQFYRTMQIGQHGLPPVLLVANPEEDLDWVMGGIAKEAKVMTIKIRKPFYELEKNLFKQAQATIELGLKQQTIADENWQDKFEDLALLLGLHTVNHVVCFDISHTHGDETVGACIVVSVDGGHDRRRSRRLKISGVKAGDDYAAISQAVIRFTKNLAVNEDRFYPDVYLIDGGVGQVNAVRLALDELNLTALPQIVGIVKGDKRKSSNDQLIIIDKSERVVADQRLGGVLLQTVRDLAHNEAIRFHQQRRNKSGLAKDISQIPGVGKVLRERLLTHFGGLRQLKQASSAEIAIVTGVGPDLAKTIYSWFDQFR